ncbi:zinc-dependent metalloprotease [Algibacter mikhailovii]|uniref:T9SS type A sorting domain-containing protein n=1 Tax=Algibacter mikhailovii TaxID=425498 RepID=A0A918R2A6_9FLAO|nr:zinc-dependent metalloprotease family protein [Algibacter mikhailovii]GGZ83980.1 hypothetical protein GCM10007028_22200 [Algibacter mikhailovii]
MKTKLHYVLTTAIFLFVFSGFAQNNFFVKIGNQKTAQKSNSNKLVSSKANLYQINQEVFSEALSKTLISQNNTKTNTIMSFPNTQGELMRYRIVEAPVMHPELQAKYPEIKSYIGYGIDKAQDHIRFSFSPYHGLSGMVLGEKETVVYEPVKGHPNELLVSNKSNLLENNLFQCNSIAGSLKQALKSSGIKDADDSKKRIYKIAISVTGEYAQTNGGTLASVNAALNATLTNVNAVFENDLNVSLQLIPTNDKVIYLNPNTDPYTSLGRYNSQLATTLDTEILEVNYDIGHLLAGINDSSGNGTGDAGCIGCVCNNGGSYPSRNHKGSAYSTSSNPSGINFDIDFVAHEIGHQFGASHTWTHDGNDGRNVQMEPGGGSTIMGYAGITGSTNLQLHSDTYFHAISIQQISTFVKGTSCATIIDTGNTTPTVSAGDDLILPVSTAFKLVGAGNDADGDSVTFCWEQINEDNAATTYPNPNSSNSNSVLFRSFPAVLDNTRYFPKLSDLKYGVNATQWEKIPNVSRTADFRLTVRDNRPGGANNTHDDMRVTFDDAYGPFEVTSQNNEAILWASGQTETITWNVNNTNNLSGASTVNILLSTDGGATYTTTLATNIANSGSYSFTVPNIAAPYCRLLIEPTNHVFYAINTHDFAINYEINTTCVQYRSADNLGITITDNGKGFTESHRITISESNIITDVNIGINVSHSYIGDLEIALLSPSNTQVLLKNHKDCSNEMNMVSVYDDDALPYNCLNSSTNVGFRSSNDLLALVNDENTSGHWTIQLGDFEPGDAGTLNSWFVEICQTSEIPLSTEPSLEPAAFALFPNPNTGTFNIKLYNPAENDISIDVYDLRGRLVYRNVYQGITDFDERIILNQVQSGLYILKASYGTGQVTRKIIVQ